MANYDDDDYAEIIPIRDIFDDFQDVIPSKQSYDDHTELIPSRNAWIDDDDDDITTENTYARHHPPRQYDESVYKPAPREVEKPKQINPLKHKMIANIAIIGYFAWLAIRIYLFIKSRI